MTLKSEEKLNSGLGNDTGALESLKLGLSKGLFMSVKFTEKLYATTMKNYATFEKELAFYFKIDTTI